MSGLANELDEIAGGLTVACEAQVPQVEEAVDRLQSIARRMREAPQTLEDALEQAREWGHSRSHHNTMMAMENYLPEVQEGAGAQPDRQTTLVRIAQADAAEVERLASLARMLPEESATTGLALIAWPAAAVYNGDLSTFIAAQLVTAGELPDQGAVQRVVQRALEAWARTAQP